MKHPRIVFIGAGSLGFTRTLMADFLTVPELREAQYVFMDIHPENLERVGRLCRRDFEANDLNVHLELTTDRVEALREADYVICTIRQGGLEGLRHDIEIPMKYGVDQCVGDTLCAGGLMYAQRMIPVLLDICRDIAAHSKPGALLLNYSNPMAMNTWACNRYGEVRTVGLCHGVQAGQRDLASVIERIARKRGWISADEKVSRSDVDITCAGINHQTWYTRVEWRGRDMRPDLLEGFREHPVFSKTEKVRIDVLEKFGYYSTESNGHLSEYLPWYRKRPEEITQWIDLSNWIHGESGAYLRACEREREKFEQDFERLLSEPPKVFAPEHRSVEHGSSIVESIETGRIYRGHFNVENRGLISNLPDGCVVELPGYVDSSGINPAPVGDLPLACAATCAASVRVQEMGMEAAVRGDLALLKQAMLHDPLIGAVCNPDEVWQMTDEMLVTEAEWLPQYAGEIDGARERLAATLAIGETAAPTPAEKDAVASL